MRDRTAVAAHPLVTLRRDAPLQQQLISELRARILGGVLKGGARLPSARQLARELGVARSTVVAAYGALADEGYLELQARRVPKVASVPPEARLRSLWP
jgi:GntR family transcriptional regulator/MocR family aminotransferase